MLRIKRVGNPAWKGRLYWIGTEETGWSDARSVTIAEQEFDGEGISVVAISDVNWNASGTVRRFRLDLAGAECRQLFSYPLDIRWAPGAGSKYGGPA